MPSARERLARAVVHVWSPDRNGRWGEVERLALPGAAQCLASVKGLRVTIVDFDSHSVQLIDLKTRTVLHRFQFPKQRSERPVVALSPDGRWLAAEAPDPRDPSISEIDVWDLSTGRRVRRLDPRLSICIGPSFSPDGRLIALPSFSGLAVYATDTLERVTVIKEYFGGSKWISFAPDRTLLALSLAQQHRIRLWDHARNEDVAILDEPQGAEGVYFTPDGDFLLTLGGNPMRTYLYRLKGPEEKLNLVGHPSGVPGIAFAPDGARLASVGKERTLKVWNAFTGHLEWEAGPLPGQGQSVSYSPDGRLLATSDFDTLLVCLWDANTGRKLSEFGTNAPGFTWSAQFSPDGRYVATAACDESFPDKSAQVPNPGVGVWTIEPQVAGQSEAGLQAKRVKAVAGQCFSLVFAPNGPRMAYIDATHYWDSGCLELHAWDATGSAEPRMLTRDLRGLAYVLSFTPDGRHLVLLDTNRSVVTLDAATGDRVASFPTLVAPAKKWNESVELSLSPDGSKVALTSPSVLGVDIWEAKTGRLLYSLPDQNGTVYCQAWSPDSRRLAVSRSNGDIDIWNLHEVERVLVELGLEPGKD